MSKSKQYIYTKHFGQMFLTIMRFIIIFGLGFIIMKPIISKMFLSFFGENDLMDNAVKLLPKEWSLYYWRKAAEAMNIWESGFHTLLLSLIVAVLQVITSTLVGYGLGRFEFKGKNFLFGFVIVIMLIPYSILSVAQYLGFVYFDIGPFTLNLTDSFWPLCILAITGLGVKEGLYIYLMKENFAALPKELEEAAYIDGAGTVQTFFRVMLPNVRSMIATIFLLSFCWQWTDNSYSTLYLTEFPILANQLNKIQIKDGVMILETNTFIARSTGTLLIMIPLVILFIVCQKFLVNSISRSGLAN